jgi:DNA-binding MarR family transcriptional regulator
MTPGRVHAALSSSVSRGHGPKIKPSGTQGRDDVTAIPTDQDYQQLLQLRTGLRLFQRWSEQQAAAAGLTPAQHQLLLAIRGHPDPRGPTIGDVAAHLLLRHHSAVGLVDRAETAGMVKRTPDPQNASTVRLRLTDEGARRLATLSEQHLEELAHLAPTMRTLWDALESTGDGHAHPAQHPALPPTGTG